MRADSSPRDLGGTGGVRPWSNVVGVARSALALGTLLTLLLSDPVRLFGPVDDAATIGMIGIPGWLNLFRLGGDPHLELTRTVAMVVLALVVVGWRPRWTAIPHWWVTWSFTASTRLPEGGDHLATCLTLLLVPLVLTDGRRWHWDAAPSAAGVVPTVVARSALAVIRLQVCVVYLHAAVAKLGSSDWTGGCALFYWMRHPTFGAPTWLVDRLSGLLTSGVVVALLTWGVMVLELLLAAALVMSPERRRRLLVAGIAFHVGIAAIQGLVSFGMAMAGALILYLRPVDVPFRRPRWLDPVLASSPAPGPFRAGGMT